jgi:hypothetical protein
MVNTSVVSTPEESPKFNTISSTRPFVFIKNPTVMLSLQEFLVKRAARVAPKTQALYYNQLFPSLRPSPTCIPPIFPAAAHIIIRMVYPQALPEFKLLKSVLSPELVKYNGNKQTTTRSSILSVMC